MNRSYYIARVKNIDEIPPSHAITMEEWSNLKENDSSLVWIGETIYGKEMDKNSISWNGQICLKWEMSEDFPKVLISNPSVNRYLGIRIQRRVKFRQVEKLFAIAKTLGAFLLDEKNKEITKDDLAQMKLDLAKKKLLKDPVHQNGFNEQARWLAIRSTNTDRIIEELGLTTYEECEWDKGFELIDNTGKLLLIPSIHSWSIITGINTPYLFYKNKEQFDLTKKHFDVLVENLIDLSKVFGDVQYFEHYNQNDDCNGYFKALNGKFVYGKYHSPKELFEKGKLPKKLKKIDRDNAFNVANIWSINPLDLVYFNEVKNKNVFLFDNEL